MADHEYLVRMIPSGQKILNFFFKLSRIKLKSLVILFQQLIWGIHFKLNFDNLNLFLCTFLTKMGENRLKHGPTYKKPNLAITFLLTTIMTIKLIHWFSVCIRD